MGSNDELNRDLSIDPSQAQTSEPGNGAVQDSSDPTAPDPLSSADLSSQADTPGLSSTSALSDTSDLSGSSDFFDPATMTVIEHLDELRTRIIRSLVVIGLAFAVCLFFGKDLVRILERPAGNIAFQALSMEEPLLVYFKISFYAAVALACPYLLFELGQFIKPGLKKNEQMILAPIVFGGPFLFALGMSFAYFFILPPMLHFFGTFGEGISPIHQRLDFYMSLVCSILLYMGLCFQLPLVIFGLSFTGLVNSKLLLGIWRYAVFGAALVAAIITPDPTAVSMLMVMGALVGLYFFSIALLKVFGR